MSDPFQTPEEKNYLTELVGEGKKFATPEDLAKGKFMSDAHIARLEAELATIREQAANGISTKELLEEIKKLKGKNDEGSDTNTQDESKNPPPQVNIEDKVLETLNKMKQSEKIEQNRNETIAKMNEVWGADAAKKLQETATSIGVSVEYLKSQAEASPSVFYKLTGLDQNRSVPSGTTVPSSTITVSGTTNKSRNWSYWQEFKRTNPKAYREPSIQVQINKDAITLGDAFFT